MGKPEVLGPIKKALAPNERLNGSKRTTGPSQQEICLFENGEGLPKIPTEIKPEQEAIDQMNEIETMGKKAQRDGSLPHRRR